MTLRSILFTPASKTNRLSKALASGADRVALDLEDGVSQSGKHEARQQLIALAAGDFNGHAKRVGVRINSLSTPDGIRDMAALLDWPNWPGMVIIPKVETPIQIRQITDLAENKGAVPTLLITLETALGVENAFEILQSAPAGSVVGFGSADHVAQTGGDMSAPSLAWARGRIVNAAAAAGIPALDGVWLQFGDIDGLLAESRLVKSIGFSGKIAIHPDQIAPIHSVFSPTDDEIETSRQMIAAFDEAGGNAFSFQGKMIDEPVLARARRMVSADTKEQI